jgi:PAS domain S-box-containing protein
MTQSDEAGGIAWSHDRMPLYYAFVRSPVTGWVTAIGAPQERVDAALHSNMSGWLTGGGAMVLIGLLFALKLGSRISRPISVLARSAEALQRGERVDLKRSVVAEVADLHDALVAAGAAARTAAVEHEQRIAAEARQAEAEKVKEQILQREASLRDSEERFRLLLSGIRDYAIIMLDPGGRIATWNPGAERLTGYNDAEALSRSFAILYQESRGETKLAEDLREAASAPYEEEIWLRRRDGGRFCANLSLSPLTNDDGSLRGFACVIRDVSERKRLEEHLKEHVEELKAAERRKDQFLATLSHELRNPIAPIRNAVEILKTLETTDAKFVWCRDLIEEQITHMARLMEDLLDVSRIAQNKLEVRKHSVDLREVIRAAVASSSPEITAAGHKLTVMLPPEPMPLFADLTRLTQAFVNLLNNAAKYVDKSGQIWLGVKLISTAPRECARSAGLSSTAAEAGAQPAHPSVEVCDGSGVTEAVIIIKDNGMGISPEILPRIFDAFSQADTASARSKGGLGIGLTLARHLITLHGGSIEAHSDGLGTGSEFTVRLPLVTSFSAGATASGGSPQTPPNRAGSKRVLVVDDSFVQAKSLCMLLELSGYETRMAHDGPGALAVAREFCPDAALIDIGLPGMNGYELALEIRRLPQLKDMMLIAQTGWGRDEDRDQSRQAGFNFHLTKPIDHQMLDRILTGAAG